MPLPVLPGVIRVAVTGQIAGGGSWANVWHIRNISLADWDTASINTLDAIFWQFYVGAPVSGGVAVGTFCPPATTFDQAAYTPLDGSSGAVVATHNDLGSEAANAMPAEVAEVITLRTALRGRQNRGRIFLPALTKPQFLADGHIDPGVITDILQQLNGVAALILAGGAEIGVGSYGPYKNPVTGVVSDNPATNGGSSPHFTPATSFSMDGMADVIRGRKT